MESSEQPYKQLVPSPDAAPHPGYTKRYAGVPIPDSDFLPDAESAGLIEYWRILRRRRGTLILIAFLGVLAAILVTLPQTPVYRARTAVEIQDVNSDFLNTKQVNPVSEDSAMNVLTDVQTQMKIIQSEALVDRVIDKFKTAGKLQPLLNESGRLSAVRKTLNLPAPVTADQDYKIRQKAMKNLTVRQLGQTRVVEILYNSTDPQFAADFVNALTAQYIESNMEARWKMSEHTEEWLSRELDDMRIKLERSESAMQEYARRAGLLFTTPPSGNAEKTNVAEDKLRQLQEELSKATAAQSHYEIAKSAPPDTLGDVLNDSPLRDLQAKLADLQRQQADLTSIYTPKHEKVKEVQAQIASIQAAFDNQRADVLTRIQNDYETALRREKLLAADYAAQTRIVTDQADKSIQYNILKREVESNRQLYENMLQQVKEASVASAIRASNIRIVDPATLPHKAYSPDYSLNAALGLLAGLLAGVAFIVMRERADRTLQEPGDAQFWMDIPELGVIPSSSLETSRRTSRKRKPALEPGQENAPVISATAGEPIELITWQRKPSMIAEAFRTVLTSVMFSGENGTRPRVLAMTSASPMDGKTTVVSNLGIALAEIRQNVLIIDADLRKPRMHQLFDLDNQRGLSTVLTERSLDHAAVNGMVQETSVPGLHILPSGPANHAAANLLYSPHLHELLSGFKKKFDMVLIDTPPSLQMTDARVIGRLSDAVVFVARAGKTTREAAVAVKERFAADRTRMLGTILNDWNPKKSPGGYYGYYKHSYYGGYKYGYGKYLSKGA